MRFLFLLVLLSFSVLGETPLPSSRYAFAPKEVALDRGRVINLDHENEEAFKSFLKMPQEEAVILIVPGYVNKSVRQRNAVLDPLAISRLKLAIHYFYLNPSDSFFVLTGGNVWPKGTIYNESREMKRYLMEVHLIPEDKIMIEPYARNSVTNLRNVGRMMLALGTSKSKIVTSKAQRFYFGAPYLSTMAFRALKMLGGMPGNTWFMSRQLVGFTPYQRVFKRGRDKLDP